MVEKRLFGKIFKRLCAALIRSQGRRLVQPWEERFLFCSLQICIELLRGEEEASGKQIPVVSFSSFQKTRSGFQSHVSFRDLPQAY